MSQDNSEIPIKATATLDDARRAAIKCLEAVGAVVDAATRALNAVQICDKIVSDPDFRHAQLQADVELEDYHPYIVHLYNALRNGWYPICQFWPRLAEIMGYQDHNLYDIHDLYGFYDRYGIYDRYDGAEPAPVFAWWSTYQTLSLMIWALPDGEALDKMLMRWPEDIASLIHDDSKTHREVWSKLVDDLGMEHYHERYWEYLIPAVEKAISTVPLEDIAEYTPPPYPTAPPRVKALPDQRGTLTWLWEQCDHYLHELRLAISQRAKALAKLEAKAAWMDLSESWAKHGFALLNTVERCLPEIPEGLSMYVDFTERIRLHDAWSEAILNLRHWVMDQAKGEKQEFYPSSFTTCAGRVKQAFKRIDSFFERELNRILGRLDEVEKQESLRSHEPPQPKQTELPPERANQSRDEMIDMQGAGGGGESQALQSDGDAGSGPSDGKPQQTGERPARLVAIEFVASLLSRNKDTLQNRLDELGIKPKAVVPGAGTRPARYDYWQLREATAEAYPDSAGILPDNDREVEERWTQWSREKAEKRKPPSE